MRTLLIYTFFLVAFTGIIISGTKNHSNTVKGEKLEKNIHNIVVKDIDEKEVKLSHYEGKVLLIVNVASYCGYTKQYAGLEEIYKTYKDKGVEILAFPCNQFGQQEPGTNEEIKDFCSTKFDVTFRLFDKIEVNGANRSPLYSILTNNEVTGKEDIQWNFEKFLIDKKGNVVARFPSKVEPTNDKLISKLTAELSK